VRRELKIPEGAPVVGMAAIFKRQKRHADFFRAARGLLDRLPESWFVLAGEPLRANQQGASDYHREVQRVADALGVLPRCVFAGNRNDMPDVYSACDVVRLTSEREGTPNVLLEAMSCGVPVIATDVADNARIVPEGEGGFIVPLGDIGAMVERLLRLLTDADFHEQMGGAARAWALRSFSTRVLAGRTEQVYLDWLLRKATIRRDRALLARLRSAASAHDASSTTAEGRDA
jgi:glycosyltransferase involved in cell wall biosynthesis